MAAEMARRPFTPGLGTFRSATSLGHSLAHFLPAPTGTGWVEKGERPRLDDSELMVKAEGPGDRVRPTRPWEDCRRVSVWRPQTSVPTCPGGTGGRS